MIFSFEPPGKNKEQELSACTYQTKTALPAPSSLGGGDVRQHDHPRAGLQASVGEHYLPTQRDNSVTCTNCSKATIGCQQALILLDK